MALRPYKNYREDNTAVEIQLEEFTFTDIKCKQLYISIIKQKAVQPKTTNMWARTLDLEINWAAIANNKLTNQTEVKVAEFNYKVLNNILATNANLFRWGKSQTPQCIYCAQDMHTSKHLLWDCMHISRLWKKVGDALNYAMTWQKIVIGVHGNKVLNSIVSLVAYIIYKKFQGDKECAGHNYQGSCQFLHNELEYRLNVYNHCYKFYKKIFWRT